MEHLKQDHADKVPVCTFFLEERCTWGDTCWFSHDQVKKQEGFKCTICGKSFTSKSELMIHRKIEHERKVKKCKNETNGKCPYGSKFCWYNHTDITKEIENNPNIDLNNQDNDITKQLFDMMENYAKRILQLEQLK